MIAKPRCPWAGTDPILRYKTHSRLTWARSPYTILQSKCILKIRQKGLPLTFLPNFSGIKSQGAVDRV
jgi:hypothetical protein